MYDNKPEIAVKQRGDMKLIPVVLSENIEDYGRKIAQAESFADYVQVDFMDGKFVRSSTVSPVDVAEVKTSLKMEAHLMVKDPISYLKPLEGTAFRRAFFHYEAVSDHHSIIRQIKDMGMQAGLAILPHTQLDEFMDLASEVDAVLFLAVDPAVYGSPFHVEVLENIYEFKSFCMTAEVGLDGGITLENLDMIMGVEPDFICVGRAIFDASEPAMSFLEFQRLIEK